MRFGVESHGRQERPLKTILMGRCGAAGNPHFGDGLRVARLGDTAGEPTSFENKKIMPAPGLPRGRGREALKALAGRWHSLAQQPRGMAERLARITEARS